MTHPTINHELAVDLFRQMIQPQPAYRVLRLLGEQKMGKSHLLTKVFALLARQTYGLPCAMVDLRGSSLTVPDILHQSCAQLGGETRFPAYYAAYESWLNQPVVEVKGLQALLASITVRADRESDPRRVERHLTAKFVADLQALPVQPLLLMFDAVEKSDPAIQQWLMNDLLVSLIPLPQVRVVMAGQTMPDAAGSYAAHCHSHRLEPVRDIAAYIAYCRQHKLDIQEQFIIEFARIFDYRPGSFAEIVLTKYPRRGPAHE